MAKAKPPIVVTCVHLQRDLHRQVRAYNAVSGTTMRAVIAKAVEAYMAKLAVPS